MKHLRTFFSCVLLALGAGVLVMPVAAESRTPLPTIAKGKGDECVEPLDVIRRDHMDLLNHQRDSTVHEGVRTKRHSLKNCIECHASKDDEGQWVPVNAPDQFCDSCHSYAAVSMDCFQCHATTPGN